MKRSNRIYAKAKNIHSRGFLDLFFSFGQVQLYKNILLNENKDSGGELCLLKKLNH